MRFTGRGTWEDGCERNEDVAAGFPVALLCARSESSRLMYSLQVWAPRAAQVAVRIE